MKQWNNFYKRHCRLIYTIIFSLLAIIIYGSLSIHNNIWYDEAYQLILNENSLEKIIEFVARDFHGPFYAVLLKLITSIIGTTPFIARMVSLSAIICSFILAFYKIEKIFNLKTSITFSFILLSFSCFYYNSIEIRPYSWPMFLTLASTTYMISIIKNSNTKNEKDFILYTLFSILAMYSHNLSLIYIFLTNLLFGVYILLKKKEMIKPYLLSFLTSFLLYLPWLFILKKQYSNLQNSFWIKKPNILLFLDSTLDLISNNKLMSISIIVFFSISLIFLVITNRKRIYYFSIITFLFTTLYLFLFSKFVTPLLITKYLNTYIGTFVLGIAIAISTIKYKKVYRIFIIINSFINYYEEIKLTDDSSINNLKSYITKNKKKNIYFIHNSEFSLGVFRYYFPNYYHLYTNNIDSNL